MRLQLAFATTDRGEQCHGHELPRPQVQFGTADDLDEGVFDDRCGRIARPPAPLRRSRRRGRPPKGGTNRIDLRGAQHLRYRPRLVVYQATPGTPDYDAMLLLNMVHSQGASAERGVLTDPIAWASTERTSTSATSTASARAPRSSSPGQAPRGPTSDHADSDRHQPTSETFP